MKAPRLLRGEPFDDPVLYDWEYRRRRDDVRFYRTLAGERGGPVLDLGCGTGRLTIPLVRDGHRVVGVDLSRPMLARAAARVARLGPAARRRVALMRADLRALPVRGPFSFAVAAFHTVQHLPADEDLVQFLREAGRVLAPGGWLAFDAFAPDADFLARDPRARWSRTTFRHPATGRTTVYTESHRRRGSVLEMTFHYQTVDARGRARGPERRVRLEHRLLDPDRVRALVRQAGLALIATWGGFDGQPLDDATEQQVYLARNPKSGLISR